jgi:predicted ribosome quality control (RQC) complex YloA/Tae2 family protein
MKKQVTGFDITRLVIDLTELVGGYFEKAYQLSPDELVFRFNIPKVKKVELYINFKGYIYMSGDSKPKPEQPSTFAMVLRKHLKNARVIEISQHDFDRILVIKLSKHENFRLILELFGEGNAVLVQDDEAESRIINTHYQRSWSQRTLRPGHPYTFPPGRAIPFKMALTEVEEILKGSKKDIVRTLAMDLNLGGLYAEEVCVRTSLDKNQKASRLEHSDIEEIFTTIRKIHEGVVNNPEPQMVYDKTEPIDMAPIKLMIYGSNQSKAYPDLSGGLEEYFTLIEESAAVSVSEKTRKLLNEKARLFRQLEQQKEAMDRYEQTGIEKKRLADLIYQHYQLIEAVLEKISVLRKKYEWDEILDEEMVDFKEIVELNPNEGLVKLRIDTEDAGGTILKLDIRLNVNKNAERYYDVGKQAREKSRGASAAYQETLVSLKKLEEDLAVSEKQAALEEAEKDITGRTGKTFWFERNRWFISSEGSVVVAGHDASSNERVVKKYLKAGDRYVHADIHGAPSVVVRKLEDSDEAIPESTLIEACQFAVVHSKAWNAEIGNISAYWVNADQVSRTPPSGEFLPKGAFIIRGKRNYVTSIELKVAIGEIDYEDTKLLMCGPVDSVKNRTKQYVIIRPGKTKKTTVAKKLQSIFSYPLDDIMKILPPGDMEISETLGIQFKDK